MQGGTKRSKTDRGRGRGGRNGRGRGKGRNRGGSRKPREPVVVVLPEGVDFRVLDGSLMEGGGQVLRNGMAYSALLGLKIRIDNVRAKRSTPGLRAQHSTGIDLVYRMVGGEIYGNEIGSSQMAFVPGASITGDEVREGQLCWSADPGTAGSIMLLVQVSLPCLLFLPGPACVTYRGGTNAAMAPMVDYFRAVFVPVLCKLFALPPTTLAVNLQTRGYFPRGGGLMSLATVPVRGALAAFDLTQRGELKRILIRGNVSPEFPIELAKSMADAATRQVKQRLSDLQLERVEICVETTQDSTRSPSKGFFVLLVAETSTGCLFGASSPGNVRKGGVPDPRHQEFAAQAAHHLMDDLYQGGCVGEYLADQLIIFMALAKGTSRLKTGPLSMHTRTAIFWAEQLTGVSFRVTSLGKPPEVGITAKLKQPAECFVIECEGIGYTSRFATHTEEAESARRIAKHTVKAESATNEKLNSTPSV